MIFISLIFISLGEKLFWSFLVISFVNGFEDSGISFKCSFGIIKECPLLSGFISRIAM